MGERQRVEPRVRRAEPHTLTAAEKRMLRQPLPRRLKHVRTELELTQERLAKLLRTDRVRVVNWESGRHAPQKTMRLRLAKVTGWPDEFFIR